MARPAPPHNPLRNANPTRSTHAPSPRETCRCPRCAAAAARSRWPRKRRVTATAAKATVRVGGYIQARETYRSDTKLTATLNRARFSADGSLPAGFTYRVLVEYEAGGTAATAASVSLRDAYVRWTRQAFSVTAGQYKTPFSPEYIMSITQVETADRAAVVDSIATKRDIGVMAQYTVGSYGTLAVGIFNGEGQNRIVNVDSSSLIVARIAARPIAFVTLGSQHRRLRRGQHPLWRRRLGRVPGAAGPGRIHLAEPAHDGPGGQGVVRPDRLQGPALGTTRRSAGADSSVRRLPAPSGTSRRPAGSTFGSGRPSPPPRQLRLAPDRHAGHTPRIADVASPGPLLSIRPVGAVIFVVPLPQGRRR